MRGWKRTAEEDAFTLADQGLLVLAMPKDPKTRGLAVVTPEEPTGDKPLLAGAILIRAYASEPKALLGTRLLEYFHHA